MPQSQTTKSRAQVAPPIGTEHHQWVFPVPNVEVVTLNPTTSRSGVCESVTSVGHKGPPFSEGGPFEVRRYRFERQFHDVVLSYHNITDPNPIPKPYTHVRAQGPVTLAPDTNNGVGMLDGLNRIVTSDDLKTKFGLMSFPSRDLIAAGTTAIARYQPLKPEVDLGQTIGEALRDGLPKLPVDLVKRLRDFIKSGINPKEARLLSSSSKDYLTYQFVWLPLLRDIQAMYKTWGNLDKRINQIIRDNNRPIRRSGTLVNSVTSSTTALTASEINRFCNPYIDGSWTTAADLDDKGYGPPRGAKTVTITEKVWFEGRFRYYLPPNLDSLWTKKAVANLFGLYPSPTLLYELIPWTWLVEWFVNAKSFLSTVTANPIGELIVDYAYIMRHYQKVTTYSVVSAGARPNLIVRPDTYWEPFNPTPFRFVITEELKQRVASTPFGFGKQISDLSDHQFAILSALSLSRSNF